MRICDIRRDTSIRDLLLASTAALLCSVNVTALEHCYAAVDSAKRADLFGGENDGIRHRRMALHLADSGKAERIS